MPPASSPALEPADDPARASLRIQPAVHTVVARYASKFGLSHSDTVLIAMGALEDRSPVGYAVEFAYLLREVQALEMVTQQVVLSNLTLAEALIGLEGGALKALVKAGVIARDLIASNSKKG